MTSKILEELEFCYDNSAFASFLVVKAGREGRVLKYQASMISYNSISHINPFEMKQNDGSCYFYYNITSKLTLSAFLKRRKLTRNEFIRVLSDVAGTIVNSDGFLLSSCGFVIKADYLYVNPVTLDIQLIYVPIDRECDLSGEFRDFVIDLILNRAELEESSSDNFLQRILNFAKNELFNVTGFSLFLNKLSAVPKEENREETRQTDSAADVAKLTQSAKQDYSTVEKLPESHKKHENYKNTKNNKNTKSNKNSKNLADKRLQKTKKWNLPLFLAVLAIQAIIAAAFLICSRLLKQSGNSSYTTFAALIMIALAIDVLLFRKLISLGLVRKATEQEQTSRVDDSTIPGTINSYGCSSIGSVTDIERNTVKTSKGESIQYISDNVINKGSYNTVLLSPDRRNQACLIGKCNADKEQIIIDKPEYIVGRLEGQVDCVLLNGAVGKVHACVLTKEGNYYISDLNSVNGTFINNIRIDSNKEYEIINNDTIAFANSEYVFAMPL